MVHSFSALVPLSYLDAITQKAKASLTENMELHSSRPH